MDQLYLDIWPKNEDLIFYRNIDEAVVTYALNGHWIEIYVTVTRTSWKVDATKLYLMDVKRTIVTTKKGRLSQSSSYEECI